MLTITDTEMSDDEIKRAIRHLESLLRNDELDEQAQAALAEIAERDRADRERLERKRHAPI